MAPGGACRNCAENSRMQRMLLILDLDVTHYEFLANYMDKNGSEELTIVVFLIAYFLCLGFNHTAVTLRNSVADDERQK